jgi:uracil-DNA glycosylase
LPAERANCLPYLQEEIRLLARLRKVVALGAYAWKGFLDARRALGQPLPSPAPRFGHLAEVRFDDGITLLGSYHPSQQNTFTGKLTRAMLRAVFERAIELGSGDARE